MILPLFGGLTEIEVIALILGEAESDPHEALVRATFAARVPEGTDAAFQRFLHDGLAADSAYSTAPVKIDSAGLARLLGAAAAAAALSRRTASKSGSSRITRSTTAASSTTAGLQECPEPITQAGLGQCDSDQPAFWRRSSGSIRRARLVQVARKEAADFDKGIANQHIVEITVGGRKLRGPALIQPGLSNYTVLPDSRLRGRRSRGGWGTESASTPIRSGPLPRCMSPPESKIAVTQEKERVIDTQQHCV